MSIMSNQSRWSKVAIFFIPPAFDAPVMGSPFKHCHNVWYC